MDTTSTAGRLFTATARRYFHIGPRTRQTAEKREAVLEAIGHACYYPGWFAPETDAAFAGAGVALRSWQKHVDGYRIAGDLRWHLDCLSMWQLTALLGQIVDACDNVGQAEVFFQHLACELRAQVAA